MKLLITGGAGFVGAKLARTLLKGGTLTGRSITQIVLADQAAAPADLLADARVQARVGPLLAHCQALRDEPFDGVFHLASAVSGECEADFELGLRSNLDSTRALLDGRVQIDGVDPVCMTLSPEETFFRAFRGVEFDISELSFSSYLVKASKGDLAREAVASMFDKAKLAQGPGGPCEMVPGKMHAKMNMYIAKCKATGDKTSYEIISKLPMVDPKEC